MVETAPELDRALEFPACLETTVKRMHLYSQSCCETAEVLTGLLRSATLTDSLRKKLRRLRDGQTVMGKEMLAAIVAATEAMKRHEQSMSELPVLKVPLTSSRDRPPATARFAVCETPGCGSPLQEAQAVGSLERRGNRICLDCEQQRDANGMAGQDHDLALEVGEMSETPQAFR